MSNEQSEGSKNWWDDLESPRTESVTSTPTLNFPRGTDNPFHDFATSARSSFVDLDFNGEATLPTGSISFDDLAKRGAGWKLHLNFDADDPSTIQSVGNLLTALQDVGAISVFKIGNGGGKAAGEPGKEATVGVGHRDKAQVVASLLEEALPTQLQPPEGETLEDDIPFTARVMGRFDVQPVDREFHKWGTNGHQILFRDIRPYPQTDLSEGDRLREQSEAITRADKLLRQRYGTFYTGKLQASVA